MQLAAISDAAPACLLNAACAGHDAEAYACLPLQEIDLLRDPWTSGRKIVDGGWKQTKAGAREFWAIFGPGGRLHPAALFESQVQEGLTARRNCTPTT